MRKAAEAAGVQLMVAYPKRYDPAFARFCDEVQSASDPRMLRVTTFESPIPGYVKQYPLYRGTALPNDLVSELNADAARRAAEAIGEPGEFLSRIYSGVLLDTLVHEINTVRGCLGEPDSLDAVDLRDTSVSVTLGYRGMPAVIHWVDLPSIARYSMEFTHIAPEKRVTMDFPSPFVRNQPTKLRIEGGEPSGTRSWATDETVSYESGFKLELVAFHNAIRSGQPPTTDAEDGIRDLALCQAIIRCAQTGAPVPHPTTIPD
jgi:predicted dehydrogenase